MVSLENWCRHPAASRLSSTFPVYKFSCAPLLVPADKMIAEPDEWLQGNYQQIARAYDVHILLNSMVKLLST